MFLWYSSTLISGMGNEGSQHWGSHAGNHGNIEIKVIPVTHFKKLYARQSKPLSRGPPMLSLVQPILYMCTSLIFWKYPLIMLPLCSKTFPVGEEKNPTSELRTGRQ